MASHSNPATAAYSSLTVVHSTVLDPKMKYEEEDRVTKQARKTQSKLPAFKPWGLEEDRYPLTRYRRIPLLHPSASVQYCILCSAPEQEKPDNTGWVGFYHWETLHLCNTVVIHYCEQVWPALSLTDRFDIVRDVMCTVHAVALPMLYCSLMIQPYY